MKSYPRQMTAVAPVAASLVLLLELGLSACAVDMPYDKYAIVYGISLYDTAKLEGEPGSPNLTYSDNDAEDMAALLDGQGYQVLPWTRTNSAADKTRLLSDIAAAAAAAREQDLFVFYFSGHGGQAGTGQEAESGDNLNEWIYLFGSITPAGLPVYSETFSDDQLVEAFADIKARKKVIIIDACNSGGFIGNELEAGDGENILDLAARAIRLYANFGDESADIPPWKALVLSAAGERELSYEMGLPYNHGVFTFYLLQSEYDGDLDHDGWVTVTEAFAYTQEMIYRDWNSLFGSSAAFSPHVSGGPVDYVLFEAR